MLSQTSTLLTVSYVTLMATKRRRSMWREGTRSHTEVYYRRAVPVPEMLENSKHVVLQFSTYQRNFHMNFMAMDQSFLRTDRKRWKNMMVSFKLSTGCRSFMKSVGGFLLLLLRYLKLNLKSYRWFFSLP